jgi:hypothetical protein
MSVEIRLIPPENGQGDGKCLIRRGARHSVYTFFSPLGKETLMKTCLHALMCCITMAASIRLGDTVYACHASAPAAVFIDWSPGKEFPAKLNGKILLVKNPNGQVVDLTIVGKKTPK